MDRYVSRRSGAEGKIYKYLFKAGLRRTGRQLLSDSSHKNTGMRTSEDDSVLRRPGLTPVSGTEKEIVLRQKPALHTIDGMPFLNLFVDIEVYCML